MITYLPPLDEAQVATQIKYLLDQGLPAIEYGRKPTHAITTGTCGSCPLRRTGGRGRSGRNRCLHDDGPPGLLRQADRLRPSPANADDRPAGAPVMISQHVTRCQKHRARRARAPHCDAAHALGQNAARQQAEAAFLPQADYGGRGVLNGRGGWWVMAATRPAGAALSRLAGAASDCRHDRGAGGTQFLAGGPTALVDQDRWADP